MAQYLIKHRENVAILHAIKQLGKTDIELAEDTERYIGY
jgi:hypothetical protein